MRSAPAGPEVATHVLTIGGKLVAVGCSHDELVARWNRMPEPVRLGVSQLGDNLHIEVIPDARTRSA